MPLSQSTIELQATIENMLEQFYVGIGTQCELDGDNLHEWAFAIYKQYLQLGEALEKYADKLDAEMEACIKANKIQDAIKHQELKDKVAAKRQKNKDKRNGK